MNERIYIVDQYGFTSYGNYPTRSHCRRRLAIRWRRKLNDIGHRDLQLFRHFPNEGFGPFLGTNNKHKRRSGANKASQAQH